MSVPLAVLAAAPTVVLLLLLGIVHLAHRADVAVRRRKAARIAAYERTAALRRVGASMQRASGAMAQMVPVFQRAARELARLGELAPPPRHRR